MSNTILTVSTRMTIDRATILCATARANNTIGEMLKLAVNLQYDPQRMTRLAQQKCKLCFYRPSRIGGAAMTKRQCGLCDTILHSGNTNVDVLCAPCASQAGLCICCGANVNLSEKRRKWPDLSPTETVEDRWAVHYETLPHNGVCPDPEHCDCDCTPCVKQRGGKVINQANRMEYLRVFEPEPRRA